MHTHNLQQPSSPPDSSEDEGKPPSLDGYEPPDDAFLMVTQQNWENKILWEVPYTPGPPITGTGIPVHVNVQQIKSVYTRFCYLGEGKCTLEQISCIAL